MTEGISEIHAQIGRLTGIVETMAENQKETNERVVAVLEKQDERVKSLETTKERAFGYIIGAGATGGGIVSGLMVALGKVFGHGG